MVPRNEQPIKASKTLTECAEKLEALVQQWTGALLQNMRQPQTEETIRQLAVREQNAVYNFISAGSLPEKISNDLLNGLRDALTGLERVELESTELMLALTKKGMPCDRDQLLERFSQYIKEKTAGKDPHRVRIHIDW